MLRLPILSTTIPFHYIHQSQQDWNLDERLNRRSQGLVTLNVVSAQGHTNSQLEGVDHFKNWGTPFFKMVQPIAQMGPPIRLYTFSVADYESTPRWLAV